MSLRTRPQRPRKTPQQSRSIHTVDTIYDATVQVLLNVGLERLTTTRVAERAGVSVGTLYQYFPNKAALLAGALHRHLSAVLQAVEQACIEARGAPIETMARHVVTAFVRAKMHDARTSRALYGVAAEVDGAAVVAHISQRAQVALCGLLESAREGRFDDAATVAFVWSTSMVGPVQGLLEAESSPVTVSAVCNHLQRMAVGYLRGEAGLASAGAPSHRQPEGPSAPGQQPASAEKRRKVSGA